MATRSIRIHVLSVVGLTIAVIACHRPVDTQGLQDPSSCAEQGAAACETACDAGDGAACLVASVAHRNRPEQMMAYELRACEAGIAQGCHFYANNFKSDHEQVDLPLARQYSERGCSGGYIDACKWQVWDALSPGDADPRHMRDVEAAKRAWQSACEHEPKSCAGLADLETIGLGGPEDLEAASRHYASACEAGNEWSCHNTERTGPDLWLQAPNFAMLELRTAHSPNLDIRGAMPGEQFIVGAVACFEADSFTPADVQVFRESSSPAMDAAVVDTMQQWRVRPRQPFPAGILACVPMIFDFKTDPHINAKFGF